MTFVQTVHTAGLRVLHGILCNSPTEIREGREELRLLYRDATDEQLARLACDFAEREVMNYDRALVEARRNRNCARDKEDWDARFHKGL